MLKVYCQRIDEPEPRLASNAFSWDEAIQFIRILVSVHGYDFRDIISMMFQKKDILNLMDMRQMNFVM